MILYETMTQTNHDLQGTRIVQLGGFKHRLKVRRDAYDFQSYSTVEVLAEDRTWTNLVSPPIEGLPIFEKSYTAADGTWQPAMTESLDALEAIAVSLL